jgi:hypothetical protein
MNCRLWLGALVVLGLMPFAPPSPAHGVKSGMLDIVHPWISAVKDVPRAPVPVHMVIRNKGKVADRLVNATSPIAARIELPPGGIEIKPGAEVVLSPTTASLRLIAVKMPLNPYDTFAVTLEFQRAGRIAIEVLVEEETATEPAHN